MTIVFIIYQITCIIFAWILADFENGEVIDAEDIKRQPIITFLVYLTMSLFWPFFTFF